VNDRSNHVEAGLTFVGVCILIAVAAFLFTRYSSNAPAAASAGENTIVAPLDDAAAEDVQPAAEPQVQAAANVPNNDLPQLGACHGGECSWSVETARNIIREEGQEQLIKVTLMGGTSLHSANQYPERFKAGQKIAWNGSAHDVYVFCSTRLPAVMMQADGAWQTDVLDFVNGVPSVLDSSAALYAQTCHSAADNYPSNGFAAKYGYMTAPREMEEPAISAPTDIFALARLGSVSN